MGSPFSRAALLVATAAILAACPDGGGSAPHPGPPAAARPTFSPDVPLAFRDTLEIALATTTAGASIRYTTDGTTPGASSTPYVGPFTIGTTTTVKAFAAGPGLGDSAVATAVYRRRAVDLAVDDGGGETVLGPGIAPEFPAVIMLNRFTPAAEDFPFQLRRIRVLLTSASAPLQLVVYSDLYDDPRSGATLLDAYPLSTIAAGGAWTEYDVEPPLTLTGPGDVLIGVLGTADFRCSVDSTVVAHRSWYGIWSSASWNGAPTLPPGAGFGVDPYNYLIRGSN